MQKSCSIGGTSSRPNPGAIKSFQAAAQTVGCGFNATDNQEVGRMLLRWYRLLLSIQDSHMRRSTHVPEEKFAVAFC
uniref:Uncharacterized protein n=1 Tax=Peronospora matthiolae TaxID=2874970 RepID=A0AAV1U746_9STRA